MSIDPGPPLELLTEIDSGGVVVSTEVDEHPTPEVVDEGPTISMPVGLPPDDGGDEPRKFYVDGGEVEVIHHLVYELDTDGKRLSCKSLTDWTGEKVRALFASPAEFRAGSAVSISNTSPTT
jgi:hypothetical protein